MVRGFDPTTSDPVKHLLDSVFGWMLRSSRIGKKQAKSMIIKWFSDSKYDGVKDAPLVRLKNRCSQKHHKIFPAEWKKQKNTIQVYLSEINNPIELKENIDRELLLSQLRKNQQKTTDQQRIQELFQACQAQYRNYVMPEEIQRTLSKKCARYLFFEREEHLFPIDSKFRLASRLVDGI